MNNLFRWIKKNRNLVPLIVLAIILTKTFLIHLEIIPVMVDFNEFYGFDLRDTHYYAIVILCATVIAYFINRNLSAILIVVMIALGMFNFIEFTAYSTTFRFQINSLRIEFQPLSFVLLCVYTVLNYKGIKSFFSIIFPDKNLKKIPEPYENKVDIYKNKFIGKSDSELKQILQHSKTLPEAKEAAHNILSERNKHDL